MQQITIFTLVYYILPSSDQGIFFPKGQVPPYSWLQDKFFILLQFNQQMGTKVYLHNLNARSLR
jgi:hypothetical protein